MADTDVINPDTAEQLKQAIDRIIESARCVRLLALDLLEDVGVCQEATARVTTVQMHAERIGWIADLCGDKLGSGQYYGGAAEWTFPMWKVKSADSSAS